APAAPAEQGAAPAPSADPPQPRGPGGSTPPPPAPAPSGAPPHQRPLAGQLRRGNKDQPLSGCGESLEPAPEAVLNPYRDLRSLSQPEPRGQLRGRQPSPQLHQRQRVAPPLPDNAP